MCNKKYMEMNPVRVWGRKLEDIVRLLQDHNSKSEYVKVVFNGQTLYSDTVNMDDAYLLITGMNKKDFDEFERMSLDPLSDVRI